MGIFFKQPCDVSLTDLKWTDYIKVSSIFHSEPEKYVGNTQIEDACKRYIRFSDNISHECRAFFEKVRSSGIRKICGVKLRGTDYIFNKPSKHAIPPSADGMINIVKGCLSEWNEKYDCLFLATEDESIAKAFRAEFGSLVLTRNIERIEKNETWYKSNMFNLDPKKHAIDYCIDVSILSQCDALIASGSQGTLAARLINGNRYEHCCITNLGSY